MDKVFSALQSFEIIPRYVCM